MTVQQMSISIPEKVLLAEKTDGILSIIRGNGGHRPPTSLLSGGQHAGRCGKPRTRPSQTAYEPAFRGSATPVGPHLLKRYDRCGVFCPRVAHVGRGQVV